MSNFGLAVPSDPIISSIQLFVRLSRIGVLRQVFKRYYILISSYLISQKEFCFLALRADGERTISFNFGAQPLFLASLCEQKYAVG